VAGGPAPAGAAPSSGPAAGAAAGASPPAGGAAAQGGLADNVAGALAYVTIIPAIIFLVIEPFKNIRFVRFHSLQCLFFAGTVFVIEIGLMILSFVLAFVQGGFLVSLLFPLFGLVVFVAWIIMVLKAYQGNEFKLPLIGDMAAKYV
jgi:uncharacterized membrane protein